MYDKIKKWWVRIMAGRKKSSIIITSNLLNVEQSVELQDRTDGFLIAGRGVEAKNEEERQLVKEISKNYNLDEEAYGFFRKRFDHGIALKDVYKAIQDLIKAICEFEKEKNVSKILSVRVPADLKAKLQGEKNPSELVRGLLEKHFER